MKKTFSPLPDEGPARSGAPAGRAEEQLAAIMAVSHAVAEGQELESTLDTIAEAGARLAGAQSAAIVLRRGGSATGLAVGGSFGLSDAYADWLNETQPIGIGSGPSGIAAQTRCPVVVNDVFTSPLFEPWRKLAVHEHFRSLVSVPLKIGGGDRVIGVLNAYRGRPGEWTGEQIELLLSLADHAAIAIEVARLLDESRRQVRGLSLVVRSLRTQGHEHANLMHAVYGLLAIGEIEEAKQLIGLTEGRYEAARAGVGATIDNSVISGFLFAEAAMAGNGGVDLTIDPESHLARLPATLTELDVVTILGNLIHNALDAIGEADERDGRIRVFVSDRDDELLIRVRDWGVGVPAEVGPQLFKSGYSTKSEHVGVGLALVRSIAQGARGGVSVDTDLEAGAEFTVRVPF
ncbi:MAG TPA: GAF domain-containing protein [Solirubrobacterales bacterium]|nr:GAF domain-containing protein [Solirubrobacterales bacterium]